MASNTTLCANHINANTLVSNSYIFKNNVKTITPSTNGTIATPTYKIPLE